MEHKVMWNDLWKMHPHSIKFLIQAVYDILPSPSSLHRWGLNERPACPLCGKTGSLEHIISCCPRALTDGCYRWQHDQVEQLPRQSTAPSTSARRQGQRVKECEIAKRHPNPTGLHFTARDRKMEADLGKQLRFLPYINETTLEPDIVLWSDSAKQVQVLQLTVP